jgi:hypothetical protein
VQYPNESYANYVKRSNQLVLDNLWVVFLRNHDYFEHIEKLFVDAVYETEDDKPDYLKMRQLNQFAQRMKQLMPEAVPNLPPVQVEEAKMPSNILNPEELENHCCLKVNTGKAK